MSELDVATWGVGPDALDNFLNSDRSPPGSMTLSEFDGFLTAIAIGPELVTPGEWLPAIWGDEEPTFDGEHEMKAVVAGIMSRFNEIICQIDEGTYTPIFWADRDVTDIRSDWSDGFIEGMALRADAWDKLIRSEEESILLLPILALSSDGKGDFLMDCAPKDEDRLIAATTEVLPEAVIAIADYWYAQRSANNTMTVTRAGPKIGRNEPCPCGSGTKYKKCCGRNA
jgi:uncharacterized protein